MSGQRRKQPLKRACKASSIDFSPLVVLILIQVIKKLLAGVVTQYYFGG